MPQGLNLIKASAGSGKTFTLARSYIEHLLFKPGSDGKLVLRLERNYHRHLLAITFTNAATDEMKRRIVKELHQLSVNPTGSDYYKYFASVCSAAALADLGPAAQRALTAIMFDYGSFNVSTIDSFFQVILRSFARELDRDYSYDVQIDAKYAVRVAVHNFLLSLGTTSRRSGGKSPVENWVGAYMQDQLDDGKDWKFFDESTDDDYQTSLVQLAENINNELFRREMPAVRNYLYATVDGRRVMNFDKITAFKKAVRERAKECLDRYNGALDELLNIMGRHGLGTDVLSGNRALAILLKKGEMPDKGPTEGICNITAATVASQFLKKYVDATVSSHSDIVAWVARVVANWHSAKFLTQLGRQLGLVGLLGAIDEQLELFRRSTNSILLADTNELIASVIDSGVPFVYERMGTRIKHYLIDEFQDTSQRQYENFKPLLEDSLDENEGDNFNMLIGDTKQAIYRFRNADPSLFRERVQRDMSRYHPHVEPLDTNYRSLKEIVEFNNALFNEIIDRFYKDNNDVVARTYAEITQKVSPGNQEGGYVTVRYKSPDTGEWYEKAEQAIDDLPALLLELHERFTWAQIGILVSKHKEGNMLVEKLLEHNRTVEDASQRIPVMSDESLQLTHSPIVRHILALLRFVDAVQAPSQTASQDSSAVETYQRRYQEGMQRQLIALDAYSRLLREHGDAAPGDLLEQAMQRSHEAAGDTAALLQQFMPDERTESSSLVNLVDHLINYCMGEGAVGESIAKGDNAFLLAFQDVVIDFVQQRNGGSVREFLRYWDTRCSKLTVPSSASHDAVTVMTIHASKGLEFDCVVIPWAAWEISAPRRQGDTYWMTREEWKEQRGPNLVNVPEEQVPPLIPVGSSELKNITAATGYFKDFCARNVNETLIDNLNKTYVAFTRPGCEMHIMACSGNKNSSGNKTSSGNKNSSSKETSVVVTDSTIGKLLYTLRPPMDDVKWWCGEPSSTPYAPKSKDTDVVTTDMPPYHVTPAQVHVKLPTDATDSRNRGVRVHNVLSRIVNAGDLERALRLSVDRGLIVDDYFNEDNVRQMLQRAFADEVRGPWFAADNVRVLTERTIVTGDSHGDERPDRVVYRPDGTVIVIDYKTGLELAEKHQDQVRGYMRLLRSTGEQHVKGYLWYLAEDKVVEVSL